MHIPRSTAVLLILVWMAGASLAQAPASGDIKCKSVSDTILGQRLLVLPDPFNPKRALAGLFPGKWYDLSQPKFANQLISWKCPRCTPKIYPDVNEMDTLRFPDPYGVATRLLNVFTYTDSSGRAVKVMSFNHSGYDPDGFQVGRFSGGLLGFATFVHWDRSWRLERFQPAIAAYGSFSQAPKPRPIKIGEGQYGFVLDHVNGGAGGPFWQDIYLIADVDGTFQQILAAYGTGRTAGFDGKSSWTATYAVLPKDKRVYRDMVITCKGHFVAPDPEGLPPELKGNVRAGQQGEFTIRHLYVYSAKTGYIPGTSASEGDPANQPVRRKARTRLRNLFNKFYRAQLLPGQIIRHLVRRPTSNRPKNGLKSVLFGSRSRPDVSLAGVFVLKWGELVRQSGKTEMPRTA